MNAQKLEVVTGKVLDKTMWTPKKAHRMALAALTGRVCPLCDDEGIVKESVVKSEGWRDGLMVVCPVCVAIEEARQ